MLQYCTQKLGDTYMTLMKQFLGAAAAMALSAGAALAEPALIFDLGGKFDKSFNEAAFNGAQRWAEETGGSFREIELQSEAQREQALRRFAEAGANPVITTGFAFADPVNTVAADYPDTKFVNIDGWLPEIPANVQLIGFQEHQAVFVMGIIALHMAPALPATAMPYLELVPELECNTKEGYLPCTKEEACESGDY